MPALAGCGGQGDRAARSGQRLVPSPEEFVRFLAGVASVAGAQGRAILTTLHAGGQRVSEAVALTRPLRCVAAMTACGSSGTAGG